MAEKKHAPNHPLYTSIGREIVLIRERLARVEERVDFLVKHVSSLDNRMDSLESSLSELNGIVREMYDIIRSNPNSSTRKGNTVLKIVTAVASSFAAGFAVALKVFSIV